MAFVVKLVTLHATQAAANNARTQAVTLGQSLASLRRGSAQVHRDDDGAGWAMVAVGVLDDLDEFRSYRDAVAARLDAVQRGWLIVGRADGAGYCHTRTWHRERVDGASADLVAKVEAG